MQLVGKTTIVFVDQHSIFGIHCLSMQYEHVCVVIFKILITFIVNLTEVVVALEMSLNHPWRAVLKQSLSIVYVHPCIHVYTCMCMHVCEI